MVVPIVRIAAIAVMALSIIGMFKFSGSNTYTFAVSSISTKNDRYATPSTNAAGKLFMLIVSLFRSILIKYMTTQLL